MANRRLTLIVVPAGQLESRSFEIGYGWLKFLLGVGVLLFAAFVVMIASWWYVAAQAARVPGLESQVHELQGERAQVAELARTLEEIEIRYERVRHMLGADGSPPGREDWGLPPLRPGPESGGRLRGEASRPTSWPLTHPGFLTRALTGEGAEHPGIDVAVAHGSYVRAAASGIVRTTGADDVYGHHVLIDHGDGYETMYGHASRLFVNIGDLVERHEVIALSGSTGRSTAPHLHFEIRKDGQPVDPLNYVAQGEDASVP